MSKKPVPLTDYINEFKKLYHVEPATLPQQIDDSSNGSKILDELVKKNTSQTVVKLEKRFGLFEYLTGVSLQKLLDGKGVELDLLKEVEALLRIPDVNPFFKIKSKLQAASTKHLITKPKISAEQKLEENTAKTIFLQIRLLK